MAPGDARSHTTLACISCPTRSVAVLPLDLRLPPCLQETPSWCHNGTMKRMNLRDVPDDVYTALAEAARASRQSLSAFVVDRLAEVAQVTRLEDYAASYVPPRGTGISLDDAAAAVREVREAS
jgi:hypothetical protein